MTTQERLIYLATKDIVDNLPEEDRAKVYEVALKLQAVMKEGGEHGVMALALVGVAAQCDEVLK